MVGIGIVELLVLFIAGGTVVGGVSPFGPLIRHWTFGLFAFAVAVGIAALLPGGLRP